jgi:putative phage-type endonuclease
MEKTMRIGGSNVAGICGISPWSTPLDEWLKITGQVTVPVNPAMEWGNRLEPIVRDKYIELTGRRVEYNTDPEKLGIEVVHPEYPFITGSLDGISIKHEGDNRVLEIKTARSRDAWDTGLPEYYELQCQQYMGLTGLQRTDVAVLFGASDFDIYELYRDDGMIKTITRLLVAFWENHVLTDIPPECTTPGDRNTRWPTSIQKAIEADELMKTTIEELRCVKAQIKQLEATQEDMKCRIKDIMQDNDTLLIGGKPALTWKQAKPSNVFDKARFEADNYELYKKYLTTKPGSRRFIIKN